MTPRTRLGSVTLAVAAITAAGLLIAPTSAVGHGYVGGSASTLISRAAWSANVDRGGVQYEPQSLEAPKGFPQAGPADGHLASAGGLFGGTLDEQTATRWQKNIVQAGPVQVAWSLTAAHRTAQWRYFITKPGWDPNDELERSDLELLATFDGRGEIPAVPTVHTLTIPADRTGYHVIYAVWDVADTTNAFYNTIDIDVRGGGAVTTPPVTNPPASSAPTGVHSMGRTASSVDLMWKGTAGATSYRVERSTDGVTYSFAGTSATTRFLDTGLAAATTYRYRVVATGPSGEAASAVFTVTTAEAAPVPSTPTTPTTPTMPTAPAADIPAWTAVGVYVRGDLRRHDGVVYRAVQSHRSWGDPSWITARALWEPVGTTR
ncbi:lytic polysaccharide monooxygenase [Microbacterium sp. NPDC089696]|uniref:lytic polysaccharide monooxygenase n=1 Tax=Microbacterium sp. NPDC089696 TaxID=3364199 RepID=UPI0037FE2434